MITNKDREWTLCFIETLKANGVNMSDFTLEIIDELMKEHRAESAEQARKEAADTIISFLCDEKGYFILRGKQITREQIIAILSLPVKEGKTDAEKRADNDAKRVAVIAWRSNEHPGGLDWIDTAGAIIQQYAESYHAKKCAECTQKKAPYKLFGAD